MNNAEQQQPDGVLRNGHVEILKTRMCLLLLMAFSLVAGHSAWAQNPLITSFSHNGVLVCTNLNSNSVAAVEWASSAGGPWQSDWTSLSEIPVGSSRAVQVSVPMLYRVRGVTGTNSAPTGMALIPAGSFTIGDTLGDTFGSQQDVTNVYVSGFYMEVYPVTYGLWRTVATNATSDGYVLAFAGAGKATNHPVYSVYWSDCVKWCNARSQQAGLTPVYYTDAGLTGVYTNAATNGVFPDWTANGYRLPTEAEWEKAARGGVRGQRYPWGNTISFSNANYYSSVGLQNNNWRTYDLETNANYHPSYEIQPFPYTNPVGALGQNGYGLYDMCGNVIQWCWDWYGIAPYAVGSPYLGGTDPRGPASGNRKVARGGSWNDYPFNVRCSTRINFSTNYAYQTIGFRCARRL